ncbi:hypothetical protein, partial [Aneurinibacillus sp. UBA3580]|uniref:hypothetical protein n=1 Tax=Aneurinibacillus sp. UBA3580 TaxID=1946041 RepID=UPI002579CEBB
SLSRSLLSFPSYHKSQPLFHDFHVGVAAEKPCSFSVKIVRKEGEGRIRRSRGEKGFRFFLLLYQKKIM